MPSVCVFAPAVMLTVTVERTAEDEELHVHPGGQGFWVARMAAVLGAEVTLCTTLGGETGDVLAHLLEGESLATRTVPSTRPSPSYIHDRREGEREELWRGQSGGLGRHELDELCTLTLAAGIAADVCVLTGTNMADELLPADTFERLASDIRANGGRVVVDLSGDALLAALAGGVDLAKVSSEELVKDGMAGDESDAEVVSGMRRMRESGAANVVVSRGGAGAFAAWDDDWYAVEVPQMSVVDFRGAGDSMTAAFAVAVGAGMSAIEGLQLGGAAGAVNVTRHGLGSGRAEAIEQIRKNVDVRALEPAEA
jgi:1-phosphofructokinase